MRAVVQRVSRASVEVSGGTVVRAGRGLLVLAALHRDDTDTDLDYIARKIVGLRVFEDAAGVMNCSLEDVKGDLLLVSQFTLYGDARKGKRPSYGEAMPPDRASARFHEFVALCKTLWPRVETGVFGAHMMLDLVNDGPVTILLDSRRLF